MVKKRADISEDDKLRPKNELEMQKINHKKEISVSGIFILILNFYNHIQIFRDSLNS